MKELYIATDGKAASDAHHIYNTDNFCLDDGKIRLVDYGRKITQEIVEEFGEKILQKLEEKIQETSTQ